MKTLKEFEKELSKCSKCAQCQNACPVYKLTKNECAVSKGKFIMLHGVTKGDLKLSKNINKYLDMCLKCGKCDKYCPAGIEAVQILSAAKCEYAQKNFPNKIINFLQSKLIFSNIINAGKLVSAPFRKKFHSGDTTVVYFQGCVNQICPRNNNRLAKIFANTGINVITPDFDCCGLPFLSEGNIKRFEQAAKDNILKLNIDCDYIVTDCASCEDTILNYGKYIDNFSPDKSKFVNWGDIIASEQIKFEFKKPVKVTFHKPCHLKDDAFFETIISNCKNAEYVKMEDYDECCGFAGTFALKNMDLSSKISRFKAEKIKQTGAEYVITTCPSCILGLKCGLKSAKAKNIKVLGLLEFLANASVIY